MVRPRFNLEPGEAMFVGQYDGGVFIVEPMRFLLPGQARAQAKREAYNEKQRTGRSLNRVRHAKATVRA